MPESAGRTLWDLGPTPCIDCGVVQAHVICAECMARRCRELTEALQRAIDKVEEE